MGYKLYIFLVLICMSFTTLAQTGIGTTTPNASAKLDVYSTNKGFLPPRVTLTSVTDATTIATPAEGLLVYNLGSVGLQAGYYYWNGANWSTIATAALAGNAVVASDLVKLYSEGYSTASGKIAHANGYSFTVPVSGRFLFDFSSSGYLNQSAMTITFKVRQGVNDLATDAFTNANNNVHVVFTGMIEVNLQAGITYNIQVLSTGSRDAGDYDRVFYKMVAGNLPVNQHQAATNIQLNSNYLSNDGGNEGIRVDNLGNVGIGNNSPTTTLDVTGTGKFSSSIINSGNRTYLGKDGASMHWLATLDAVAEPNNLAYGFESNGSSIQSHKWYTGGTQKMQLMSSGKLGLGTATPGTSLHIENGNTFGTDPSNTTSPSLYIYNNNSTSTAAHASATIRSNSSTGGNPYLSFDIAGVRGYSIGIDNADGDKFKIQNSWNFSSNPILTLTTDNRVGIGTTSPAAPLHVASNVTQYVGPYGYLAWNGSTGASSISQNINYSIQTDERIRAPEFNAISDTRIKKDISKLNTANQLTELNKLSPVNYAYIDQLVNGNKHKTGFIAQEVEQVNPQFVNKSTDFIPSVFALAKSVTTENGMLKMTTEKPHDFAKGDVIKIFSEGKKEVIKTIEEVIDLHSFSIKGWNEPLENIFIYGKKINDFRAIDFDQITALSVAAIQELSKQMDKLKLENEKLQFNQNKLDQRLKQLESKIK